MESPNRREGIDEILEEFNDRSNDRMFLEDECRNSFWFEEGEDIRYDQDEAAKWLTKQFKNLLHQELQKALEIQAIEIREEEANEYNKIIEQELQKERERCITKAWSYIVDATHAESWSRDELRKAVQSELDQPNK